MPDLTRLYNSAASKATSFATEHPFATCGIAVGITAIAGLSLVAAPALGAAGSTSGGIGAGTAAAAGQSMLQPIVSHGAFAVLQSAGAGGYGVPIVHGVVQGAGAVLAGALGYAAARDDDGASTEEENGQKTRGGGNRKAKEVDEQKPKRTLENEGPDYVEIRFQSRPPEQLSRRCVQIVGSGVASGSEWPLDRDGP